MSIEGGEDLRDTNFAGEPTDEWGRQFDPFTGDYFIGNFPSDFMGMTIGNPQPGYIYKWVNNDDHDEIHYFNKYGAEPIKPGDPETIGSGRLAKSSNTHADTISYGGLMPIRISQARYDDYRNRQAAESRDTLPGVVSDFMDRDPGNTRYDGSPRYPGFGKTGITSEILPDK